MKKLISLILAAALVLSLAACAAAGGDNGSTLVYGSGDYDSINPIMNEHCEIKHLIFDSLVKRDGEAFTAEDVRFTIEAIMDPENGSGNYPNYAEVQKILVRSDTEIAFVLSEPNFAFLDYMTMSILPEHLLTGEDLWESDYFKHPIGTGPYQLDSRDVGQAIVDAVLLGEGFPAYSPIQLNRYNYEGAERYDYDPASAAAFEAAGCEKDAEGFWCRNGERIGFTINATPGDQVRIDMAQSPAYTYLCYIDAMFVADSSIRGIDRDTVLGHHGVGIFWNITEWSIGS